LDDDPKALRKEGEKWAHQGKAKYKLADFGQNLHRKERPLKKVSLDPSIKVYNKNA